MMVSMTDDAPEHPLDEPLPPDALGRRLTEVFALVGPLYRQAFRKVERAAPTAGVPVGVRAVLDLLRAQGPLTVPQMSRQQAISRQFFQRMVNDALAHGWVETVPNPAHRRSPLIRLTDPGRATITAVLDREHQLMRRVGGELTEAEVRTCLRVLTEMLHTFEDGGDDPA
jgi:DNA-binding MarR family transcriptional regulator